MSWLTINGVELEVAHDSAVETPREIGLTDSAYDGTLRKTRQTVKTDLSCKSTILTSSEARAWSGMIRGLPDVWDFESHLYSAKGTPPVSGHTDGSITATPTVFGNGRVGVLSTLWYAVTHGPTWSISVWRINQNGSGAVAPGYDHYVFYSDGVVYKNGAVSTTPDPVWCEVASGSLKLRAPGDYATTWAANTAYAENALVKPTGAFVDKYFICTTAGTSHAATEPIWPANINDTIVDGTVTWTHAGLYKLYIDELVFFPFAIPTSWVAPLYASRTAFGASPKLTLTGDAINDVTTRYAMGNVTGEKFIRGHSSGFKTNMRQLDIEFSEV